jgi:hypothetical protein
LKLTNDLYKSASPLNSFRKNIVMAQVKSLISEGGPDTVLSLLNDDIIPGMNGADVPEELYKPENYRQLEELFLNRMSAGFEAAALSGYQDVVSEEESRSGRKLGYNAQRMQQTYDFKKANPSPTAKKAASTTSSKKGPATIAEIDAERKAIKFQIAWEKLPSGGKMKGPDGKTYSKP